MNKNTLERMLKELDFQYPKDKCCGPADINSPAEMQNNYMAHRHGLYDLTCMVDDLYCKKQIQKKTAVEYGRILKSHEYFQGEAGLGHFHVFDSITGRGKFSQRYEIRSDIDLER